MWTGRTSGRSPAGTPTRCSACAGPAVGMPPGAEMGVGPHGARVTAHARWKRSTTGRERHGHDTRGGTVNSDALVAALGPDAVAAVHGYRLALLAEADRRGLRLVSEAPTDAVPGAAGRCVVVDPIDIRLAFVYPPSRRPRRTDPDVGSRARLVPVAPACERATLLLRKHRRHPAGPGARGRAGPRLGGRRCRRQRRPSRRRRARRRSGGRPPTAVLHRPAVPGPACRGVRPGRHASRRPAVRHGAVVADVGSIPVSRHRIPAATGGRPSGSDPDGFRSGPGQGSIPFGAGLLGGGRWRPGCCG
jgi:hypothetical protein